MSLSIAQRPTIVDRLIPKSIAIDVALIAAGVVLMAASAQWVIPMYPVPMTGQTFAVLFIAMALGFERGSISVLAYVALGAAGLPIFNAGTSGFWGPTLGYKIGFIAAAALVGFLAQREWDKSILKVAGAFAIGSAVIYLFGATWLAIFIGLAGGDNSLMAVLNAGVLPFLIGDAAKAAAAAALLPAAWAGVKALKK